MAETIIKVAESELGVQEIPRCSNGGLDVEKYLKSVGLGKGNPWCMAFVYWVVKESFAKHALATPLVKTGGVLRQWNEVPKRYKFVKDPQPGDIFIMDFGGGFGHTGFVTSVANGRIQTIEGNSNSTGSREGQEVCRNPKGRLLTSIKGYVRVSVQ